jgi:hypothetical protein
MSNKLLVVLARLIALAILGGLCIASEQGVIRLVDHMMQWNKELAFSCSCLLIIGWFAFFIIFVAYAKTSFRLIDDMKKEPALSFPKAICTIDFTY